MGVPTPRYLPRALLRRSSDTSCVTMSRDINHKNTKRATSDELPTFHFVINPKEDAKRATGDELLKLMQETSITIDGRKWFLAKVRSEAGKKEYGVVFGSAVENFTAAGISINSKLYWHTQRFGDMVFIVELSVKLLSKSIPATFRRTYPTYHVKRLDKCVDKCRHRNDQYSELLVRRGAPSRLISS